MSTTTPSAPLVAATTGERTLAELYTDIGLGLYQLRLFVICGMGYMADSIETGVIVFLEAEVEKVWNIRGYEKNALALAVFFGEFLGCFVWGPLADHIGRKKTFLLANSVLLLLGCASAAAPSFWCLVFMRCLVGISIGGIVVPFDTLLEGVADEHKNVLGYAMQFWWTVGTLFISGLAAVVLPATWGGWRVFVLLSACPILVVCICSLVVDESPAWLQDVGCNEEALDVLRRAARDNGKDITGLTLLPYERETNPSIRELFSPALRRRTLSLSSIWLLGLFGYYGASLANSFIFDEGGTINYSEVAFAGSGEVAGILTALLLSHYLGDIWVLGICYQIGMLGALGILATALVPHSGLALKACLAFLLRLGVMGGSTIVWVVTPPAYPTHVRSTAHGFLYGAGRIGGLLATLWPSSTPAATVMCVYAVANGVCSIISFCEGRVLQRKDVFESLASDLHATDLERRSRSVVSRSIRLSTGLTGRPSLSNMFQARLSGGSIRWSGMLPNTRPANVASQ